MQLIGVTHGLNYLHNNEVVHGDLKSVCVVHRAILPNSHRDFAS